MKNHWMDIHSLGVEKQENRRPEGQTMCGQICGNMSDAAKRKEKQKWAIEKPKLENGKRLRGIF